MLIRNFCVNAFTSYRIRRESERRLRNVSHLVYRATENFIDRLGMRDSVLAGKDYVKQG